jgi:signal transduction histidine kinase
MKQIALAELIRSRQGYILDRIARGMERLPGTPYRKFLIETDEGRRRLSIWIKLVIDALSGNPAAMIEDQARVGYYRAMQGFQLKDVFEVYRIFQQVCFELLSGAAGGPHYDGLFVAEELRSLYVLFSDSWMEVTKSYVETREQQIREKVHLLQELGDFTQLVFATFDVDTIVQLTVDKMSSLFTVKVCVRIYRDDCIHTVRSSAGPEDAEKLARLESRYRDESSCIFVDEQGNSSSNVSDFLMKRFVVMPIEGHAGCSGILTLSEIEKGFKFGDKDLSLVKQFLYIMGMALENAFMVEQIEQNRQALRMLAGKMIVVKDEERKTLAAELHDTLAQSLTGISYKVQFCRELLKRNREGMDEELGSLVESIHQAIDQCRSVISNLHPDLIDTVGLVPALRRLFQNFTKETHILVSAELPKDAILSDDLSIRVYRVIQEALTNVYKHANAKTVEISLAVNGDGLKLVISDDGKGFDKFQCTPEGADSNKLGLLYMKERVESVGGTVAVESAAMRGCTIRVSIPCGDMGESLESAQGDDCR